MTPTRRILIQGIASDVRSNMTDFEIMEKYQLSSNALRDILQKLFQVNLISTADLYRRTVFYHQQNDAANRRRSHRNYLTLLLPVYEVSLPELKGWVTDLTEFGVGTRGLPAKAGDLLTLVVLPERYAPTPEIVFDAACQWVEAEGTEAEPTAGFEITEISNENLDALRALIRFVTVDG
ncbi:MAG: hypothetical protein AB1646_00695 [Thermodesulfobacteriota bacterium]